MIAGIRDSEALPIPASASPCSPSGGPRYSVHTPPLRTCRNASVLQRVYLHLGIRFIIHLRILFQLPDTCRGKHTDQLRDLQHVKHLLSTTTTKKHTTVQLSCCASKEPTDTQTHAAVGVFIARCPSSLSALTSHPLALSVEDSSVRDPHPESIAVLRIG